LAVLEAAEILVKEEILAEEIPARGAGETVAVFLGEAEREAVDSWL